jgi:RNA polymerase sigma-70 factor (ECF subfamily)
MKIDSHCAEIPGPLVLVGAETLGFDISNVRRRGEETISDTLFWDYLAPIKHKLYNFVLKSLNFSVDADDVFQETILRAFQYFRSFQKDKNFSAWLFSIAHNEVKRSFKKSRRQSLVLNSDALTSTVANPSDALVREVYRFAGRLRPREREIFFLFYESGFSIAEISDISGLKEGYIKLLLFQARNNLKKIIGAQNE